MKMLSDVTPSGFTNWLLNKRFSRVTTAFVAFVLTVYLLSLWSGRPGFQAPSTYLIFESDFSPFPTTSHFSPVSIDPTDKTNDQLCATFPKHMLNYVQPVLKTGRGEDPDKVTAQMDSVSSCFSEDELIVVSDLAGKVGKHQAIDVIADLPPPYFDVEINPDIKHYLMQKEASMNGSLANDPEMVKRIDGWKLDKYKFLPMVQLAWKIKPDRPFYFFYEIDTYVFWDNAFRFLEMYDPDVPIYMGSPSGGREDLVTKEKTQFGNGGPGFVLSRGAIKLLLARESARNGIYKDPDVNERWLTAVAGECCGDSALGFALWNAGVALQGYWPMFNPHPAHSIPYGDTHWCHPTLTLHKSSNQDMVDLWKWEFGARQHKTALTYSDMWNFRTPGAKSILDDWDNGAHDSWVPGGEPKSFADCEKLCEDDGSCVQWLWKGRDVNECVLMRTIRYGEAKKAQKIEDSDKWVDFKSGWMVDRVAEWKKKHPCNEVQWVPPSVTRIF